MKVASPSCVQERKTTMRTMSETAATGRSTRSPKAAGGRAAASAIRRRISGSAGRKSAAAAAAGRSSQEAPCSPWRETRKMAAGAPMANPRFPPTEKSDIPVARLTEAMQAVALNPSGWKAAVPSPVNITKATSHAKPGENGTSAMPIPDTRHPRDKRTGNGFRSVAYPNSGWITEEVRWAASSSVPVTV